MSWLSSTTLPDICGPSLPSAGRLCDDCSSLGHEIRQLCEVKDYSLTKPRASVERNRTTCAFCEMIASRLLPKSAKSVGDFIIHNKTTNEAISLIPRPTNGIDKLEVKLEREGYIKLAVLTNEG